MSERDDRRTQTPEQLERDRLEALLEGADEAAPNALARNLPPLEPEEETDTVVAVLSAAARKGAGWEPAARISVFAFWGAVELDFREADLLEGETVVDCRAIMGAVEVIVPPDVDVRTEGVGFLGTFSHLAQRTGGKNVPTILLRGFAVMGSVEVKVR